MKFEAQRIVVDADVARSAGLTEHPVSKNSREVLQSILNSQLSVSFCKTLSDEWRKHASIFAKRWLTTMIAKKKWSLITPHDLVQNDIINSNLTDGEKAAAIKDAHVINNAIQTDKFIASNDKIARGIYSKISQTTNNLNDVTWAIPAEHGTDIQRVFSDGGFIPNEWNIKNHS